MSDENEEWQAMARATARRIDAAVEAHFDEAMGERTMYAIEYNGATLYRYSGGDKPPRWGWGPDDWQAGPQWHNREMLFDLPEEAEQCLAKIGAMGAGAEVVEMDRPRGYHRED